MIRAPTRFFRTPPRRTRAAPPIGFGLGSLTVGQVSCALLVGLFFAAEPGLSFPGLPDALAAVALMAPGLAIIGIIVSAACSHCTLALMRSNKGRFTQTLHVTCYAKAPHVFFVVPCVGPLLVFGWVAWLEAVGLREVHGISTGRAVVPAFGWRVVFATAFLVAYILFMDALSPIC